MGPMKKTPSPKTIKSRLFSGTDPLTVEDFAILSVDGLALKPQNFLMDWIGQKKCTPLQALS